MRPSFIHVLIIFNASFTSASASISSFFTSSNALLRLKPFFLAKLFRASWNASNIIFSNKLSVLKTPLNVLSISFDTNFFFVSSLVNPNSSSSPTPLSFTFTTGVSFALGSETTIHLFSSVNEFPPSSCPSKLALCRGICVSRL